MTRGFGPRFAVPILIGPALNPINATMIAVALVPISRATDTPTASAVWLVASLYLASAVAQPFLGWMVDRIGARAVTIAGMALAGLAGLLPLVWPSFAGALVARIVIGIGTSAAYPSAMASIALQAERVGREPPRALFAALSVSNLVTAAVGPVLGGVLVVAFGWQAIFVVNTPWAVVAIIAAAVGLPPGKPDPGHRSAGGRVARGRHLRGLVTRGDLLRTYARLVLVSSSTYLMLYGFLQWLQAGAGYSAGEAGWMQLPAVIVAGLAAASLSRTRRVRLPLAVAAAVPVVGGMLVLVTHAGTPVWLLLVTVTLFGLPQGLAAVTNQAVLYAQAPRAAMGTAAGLSRTFVQAAAVAASAVIGAVFGAAPTDAGLHVLGGILVATGVLALVLCLADPALRRAESPRPDDG